jgi:hypothetical protein
MTRPGFEERPPVTIHCVEQEEQLALLTIEVTNQETEEAYGCRDFDLLDNVIKAALMTYLKDMGIDHDLAKFAAALIRYKKKQDFYLYLKNMRAFVLEGEENENGDEDSDDENREKINLAKKFTKK